MGDGPYVCYRELAPPTSVVGAEYFLCYNRYTKQYDPYLATIAGTVLNLYRVVQCANEDKSNSSTIGNDRCAELSLAKYQRIFGKAKEVKAYHRGNQQHDLLIIAIDEGKIIAIEYVPDENQFNESIICNVEDNAFGVGADIRPSTSGKNTHFGTGMDPIIRVSNQFQMLCISVYGEEILIGSFESNVASSWQANNIVHQQLLSNLRKDLKLNGPILDMCFLHGYGQPTIAILQEENFLPIGHVKTIRNTCTLTAIAVDLNLKAIHVLWKRSGLPHDSLSIMELPTHRLSCCVGVVSQNAFLVVGEQSACALAMNGFASISVDRKSIDLSPWVGATTGVELDGSFWTIYNAKKNRVCGLSVVGVLRNGAVLCVEMGIPGNGQLSNLLIEATIIGHAVHPSCCCSLNLPPVLETNASLLFVGSRSGQCVLYSAIEKSFKREGGNLSSIFQGYTFIDVKSLKKRKLIDIAGNVESAMVEDEVDVIHTSETQMLEEELELYGDNRAKLQTISTVELHQIDYIDVMGPILHGLTTKPDELFSQVTSITWDRTAPNNPMKEMHSHLAYIADKEMKESLIVASGLDESSSMNRVFSGVGLGKVGSRNFPGATRMFTLTVATCCLLFVSYESKTKVLQCRENVLNAQSFDGQHYPDLRFVEVPADDPGFIVSRSTLGLAVIYTSAASEQDDEDDFAIVVQVVPIGLRLTRVNSGFGGENEPMQDMLLSDGIDVGGLGGKVGETICAADFLPSGYVAVVTNLQNMYIIRYVPDEFILEVVYYQESKRSIAASRKNKTIDANTPKNNPLNFLKSDIVSASLYKGKIEFAPASLLDNARPKAKERNLSDIEQEELALYGKIISPTEGANHAIDESMKSSDEDEFSTSNENTDKNILIITDVKSNLYFVDIESGKCLWESAHVDPEAKILRSAAASIVGGNGKKEDLSNRYIIETKLGRLTYRSGSSGYRTKLVLLALFHTGELLTFDAFEVTHPQRGNSIITGFYKSLSKTVQNKRFTVNTTTVLANSSKSMAKESVSPFTPATPITPGGDLNGKRKSLDHGYLELDPEHYLLSEDYLQRGSILTCMQQVEDYFPSDIILIGCSDPLVLALPRGHCAFFPLDFPETPYVNAGNFIVRPFHTKTFSFLATMWYEFEDLDSLKNPQHMKNRAQKQSTWSLFRFLPRQILSPYGGLSRQQMTVKQTVHKCQEILKLSDDTTEQALLDKKTYLLLCSSDKLVPFSPGVVSGEDSVHENEIVASERYFVDLESFAQPDFSLAPAPALLRKEFKVSLVQNGRVVDSFPVKENEKILDMTVAYFNVERKNTGTAGSNQRGPAPSERRIFVVVSTLYVDPRGEDTQGNGRILLLSLDYAMFGNADNGEKKDATDQDEARDITGNDGNESSVMVKEEDSMKIAETKAEDDMDVEDSNNGLDKSVLNQIGESAKKKVKFDGAAESKGNGAKDEINDVRSKNKASNTMDPKKNSSVLTAQKQFLGSIQPKLRLLSETAGPASVVMQVPNSGIKESAPSSQQIHPWSNYVITTIGSTLYIHKFNSSTFELNQLAFFFAQFYITSVTMIKNYIAIGDMFHSVQLLYFREEDCSIHLVAKDYDHRVIVKTDIMIDGTSLAFVTADDRGNIQLFQEKPRKIESLSGVRLLNIGDFHLGSEVGMLLSHEMLYAEPHVKRATPLFQMPAGMLMPPPPPPPPKARKGSSFPLQIYGTRLLKQQFVSNASLVPGGTGGSTIRNRRLCTIVGTMDGSLGCMIPVEEKMYKRLTLLQQIMTMLLPSTFALNPRDFRTATGFRIKHPFLQATAARRVILDGCLLFQYWELDNAIQEELAHIIGSSAQVLRENLYELDILTRFF